MTSLAYYNEHDPYAAQWLRNLIEAGEIAPGVVDERDIRDVTPAELEPYTQCHFFAGIGIWSLALRRAGWSDDRPVWTGSCPCQPFSTAGSKRGLADERHLWPHWHYLIEQCQPPVVFGEQVASKDGLVWIDLVSADLQASGYACAPVDICAAGFSGAHIRQRLYFVGVGDRLGEGLEGRTGHGAEATGRTQPSGPAPEAGLPDDGLGNTDGIGLEPQPHQQRRPVLQEKGSNWKEIRAGNINAGVFSGGTGSPRIGRTVADWLLGTDGTWRPVEPGSCPVAAAYPGSVEQIRAYGNALDAETAQNFIEVVMECL